MSAPKPYVSIKHGLAYQWVHPLRSLRLVVVVPDGPAVVEAYLDDGGELRDWPLFVAEKLEGLARELRAEVRESADA